MNRLQTIAAIALMLLGAGAAHAQTIPNGVGPVSSKMPKVLENVGFEPQLNAQMPLDLPFRDEAGKSVTLRNYFGQKPVVLAFVYYTCPMLCDQVQQGVVGSLR